MLVATAFCHKIICGYYNINLLENNIYSSTWINTLLYYNMYLFILLPTWEIDNTVTFIDNIFTNFNPII